jgi:hypothetical protein
MLHSCDSHPCDRHVVAARLTVIVARVNARVDTREVPKLPVDKSRRHRISTQTLIKGADRRACRDRVALETTRASIAEKVARFSCRDKRCLDSVPMTA